MAIDGDGLRVAVGDVERVDDEIRGRPPDHGHRVVRVGGGPAVDSANGRFLSNSAWIRPSSSGKLKPLSQSSVTHSSSGTESETVSHVDISGVNPSVRNFSVMWVSVSPLVV